jgi:hypothetical protein
MRRSILFGAPALALATLAAVFLLRNPELRENVEITLPVGGAETVENLATSGQPLNSTGTAESGAPANATPAAPPFQAGVVRTETPPAVEKRIAELQDLGTLDDPASLKAILAELANPDPEIRKAALDAAIQFSSRDAIPALAEAAARATDAEEKKELLEAIEFLKLPSLTEYLQQRGNASKPIVVRPAGGAVTPRFSPVAEPAAKR